MIRSLDVGRTSSGAQGLKQQALKRGTGHRLPVRKAAGNKLADLGPRNEKVFIKFTAAGLERRGKDPGIGGVLHVKRNLVW